jgi:3',5'-cyclic AMP phosphodiesterase CpdA
VYLFRFRDLVADTLLEHRKTIDAHGHCFWGWWKRPTEDARSDVWSELANATESQPLKIGLLDTGTNRVFEAAVVDVIPPTADGSHPPVPTSSEHLVPSYYRDSPFSFGWLKLKSISTTELDFFKKYSLAEKPQLPGYPSDFLDSLVGNVIIEPSELRGMDTTIWSVRKRAAGDKEERIVTSARYVVEPISAQPIACPGSVILHITDPHFSVEGQRDRHAWRLESEPDMARHTMADAIMRAVKGELNNRRIGLILVTGDLTFMSKAEEFTEASKSLLKMLGPLDLSTDNLVVLPGNHDIAWSDTIGEYSAGAPVNRARDDAEAAYRTFYKNVLRHGAHATLACARRFVLPNGMCLEVAALNSSSLETGKDFLAGVGRVQEEGFSAAADGLSWSHRPTMALRILAIHHHLALTENLEPFDAYGQGFGIAVDAPRILRLAARNNVQLAIHGHKHRAFVWRSNVYELPEHSEEKYDLGAINIIGGGSAGSTEVEAQSNYFNLIEVSPDSVQVELFKAVNGGQFMRKKTWSAPLSTMGGEGLKMAKWEVS